MIEIITVYIPIILVSFYIGWLTKSRLDKKIEETRAKEVLDDINTKYSEVFDNIKKNKSSFKNRVNSTVWISTQVGDLGEVSVLYQTDKEDISIFKEDKCLYTSAYLEEGMKQNILSVIRLKYNKQINDVVNVMGFIFSKEEFERNFNVSAEQIEKYQKNLLSQGEISDIDKIKKDNDKKLSLDGILDKISQVGYDSLSEEEKEFLKKIK